MDIQKMIEAGATDWEKGNCHRIYFDCDSFVKYFELNVTPTASYAGELKEKTAKEINKKHKFWFDVNNETINTSNGELANIARAASFDVKRI